MRRKPKTWEQELDLLSDDISDLIDKIKPVEADDLITYLDAAEPALRRVQGPGPLQRFLRRLSIVLNLLVFAMCIALIAGAAMYSTNADPDNSFWGVRLYHVISKSMTPTTQADGEQFKGGFYEGDAILVKNATAEEVKQHDVITFWRWKDDVKEEFPITHRVMEIVTYDDEGKPKTIFITKGDNNRNIDASPVESKDLIGIKLFSVPQLGRLLAYAQDHFAMTIVICVVMIVVMFVMFIWLTGMPRRRKRKAAKLAAQSPKTVVI